MNANDKAAQFFPLWFVLAAGFWLLLWRGSYEARKTWAPRLVVLFGLVFLGFVYLTEGTGNTLYFAVPGVALITFINLKAMRFCRECGAYNRRFGAFTSSNYCSKCGHSFDERGDV